MAYADTTRLKLYLGIASGETTDDTLLSQLLAASQQAIDDFCRQTFEAASDSTRYFDAVADVRGSTLHLDAPLCAITSVTNGDGSAVSDDAYVKEPRNTTPWWALTLKADAGVMWTHSGAPENAIAIVGKWAYSVTAPATIAQTTVRLAAYLYRQKNNASDLDRAIAIGSNAMLLPPELPRDIQTFLFRGGYRRLVT